MFINWQNLYFESLPVNIILLTGIVVLFLGMFCRGKSGLNFLLSLTLLGISASVAATFYLWKIKFSAHEAMITVDSFAYFFYILLLGITFLSSLSLSAYLSKQEALHPEVYSLTLFSLSGMMLMVSTTNLILFFLALEVMSIGIYTLVGIKRRDPRSNEAAMKYFLLGAMIAGFLLYGMSLIYGTTGQFDVKNITQNYLIQGQVPLLKIGVLLVMVALAFKVGAVPFHFWVPDVYEGAPISVSGFMATAVKTAAFGALLRILNAFIQLNWMDTLIIVGMMALATMVIGNLVALYQTNLKRMLAYSSIAHAGYVLVGVTAAFAGGVLHPEVLAAPLFYLFAYSVVTLGAFTVAAAVATQNDDGADLSSYAGLSKRSPILAASMAIFMLALTGIPPTVGFAGKFYIFREAIKQGLTLLVIVGVLMSAVSAYYYLRVIVAMYFVKEKESQSYSSPKTSYVLAFIILVCVLSTFYFGLFPSKYFQIAQSVGFTNTTPSALLP